MARDAVAFVRALRDAGLDVSVDSSVVYVAALAEIDALSRDGVYWAGRVTLVHRVEDIAVYDDVFAAHWRGHHHDVAEDESTIEVPFDIALEGDDEPDGASDDVDRPALVVRASTTEVLRHKDFARCSPEEVDEARRLMADLRVRGALRRSRRLRRARRRSSGRAPLDVRTTVRRAVRTGGEVGALSRRERRARPRPLVLLLDISGSMDPYARALLRFAHAAVAARRRGRVEAFALGTRLTRLTRALGTRDADTAMAAAAAVALDWSGGTRLGDGLRAFNDEWGVRGLARGATVVVLSDGWDRGDPAVLAEQMARLARVAHRIVWVNPLKASDGYEPLARGMGAALPYVDDFVEGHSVAALEHLAAVVAGP